jgi:S-formylglutathione hydrolase FrmB
MTTDKRQLDWSSIEVAGKPCDVFEPAAPNPHGYAIVYLHGVHSTRLIDNAVFSGEFNRHGLRVIAPLTGPCWWTNRIYPKFDPHVTAEQHVLNNVLPYLERRWKIAPPGIALLGSSMGGQGALRFAFKFPSKFQTVTAMAPAIDYQIRWHEGDEALMQMYDDPEQIRQDTATLHVHPLNWPRNIWFCCDPADDRWHESADKLRMKLNALGIPHEHDLETTGGGHSFEYYNRMAPRAIQFIAERLERTRLSV